jgi:hypothetical protein
MTPADRALAALVLSPPVKFKSGRTHRNYLNFEKLTLWAFYTHQPLSIEQQRIAKIAKFRGVNNLIIVSIT